MHGSTVGHYSTPAAGRVVNKVVGVGRGGGAEFPPCVQVCDGGVRWDGAALQTAALTAQLLISLFVCVMLRLQENQHKVDLMTDGGGGEMILIRPDLT